MPRIKIMLAGEKEKAKIEDQHGLVHKYRRKKYTEVR